MYDLGIIGGMGPESTAEIFTTIIKLTWANRDQDHMKICLLNKTEVPDRTDYLLGNGESPLPYILEGIDELESLKTKHFIIPCNTAHIFADHFKKRKNITFIDMVEETRNFLKEKKVNRICLLATNGTVAAKVYEDADNEDYFKLIYPSEDLQKEVMEIILSVKSASKSNLENKIRLINIMREVHNQHGDYTFVIACTELSTILADETISGIKFVDAMEILAINAIIKCGYKLDIER